MAARVARGGRRWLVVCAQVARRAGRPPFACDDGRRLVVSRPRDCAHGGARWTLGARWPCDARLRRACRAQKSWWRHHRPAPLRRVSDDVVTAGLISSRVWFGPVPGSP
ncbi:valyl-tRNA synthetase [Dorcoceras hygrometricum]|uniref:Valyl-tRNA synthetase n=1 Tax=Dorcoceras hygrometricum TaxID=472368 RepID=A0A2Z6ZS51_9LAMI|nr:valyl-tRNA synthetase [Dorcoceras hygrometricum]